MVFRNLLNLSYSLLIWKASSLVWHITSTDTCPSTGSICCSVASTNTAVCNQRTSRDCHLETIAINYLSHAGLGLAENVHAEHRLGDALVLHLTGMLETAVHDGSKDLPILLVKVRVMGA